MFKGNSLPQAPMYQSDHNFSKTPNVQIPRSTMDRSHDLKTTFDAGYLIPIFVDEALPGDTYKMNMTGVGRLATPIYPIMDNIYADTFFFHVPLRLLQDNFVKIHGEQVDPGDSIDYLSPKVNLSGGVSELSLYDYLGYPIGTVYNTNPNNYAARAYNMAWNEYFRDQNLQDSVVVDKDDGVDDPADYVLLKRGKRHDYFTGCLPWPQKGDAVSLPLGDVAPVLGISFPSTTVYGNTPVGTDWTSDGGYASDSSNNWSGTSPAGWKVEGHPLWSGVPYLRADLSEATASSINEIRLAFQTQKVLERDARGGTRYIEHIKSHFGVVSPDQRLQRPELIGMSISRINIQEVPQTSSTDATSPQGNLSALGTVVTNCRFTESFTEHGIIIGLTSLRAELSYSQGLPRMFSRNSRFDWYYPSLAHIGEQSVLNKEIYADGTAADDDVFGYQERWAEYRYKSSVITGRFRSNAASSLDAWHLSIDFASRPSLNSDFIQEDPPFDRVVAVTSEPHMLFNAWFDLKCTRPMPIYSVPGLIDHF